MYKTIYNKTVLGFGKILLSGMLILAIQMTSFAQKEGETLTGRIVDENGKPVAGAIVNVAEENRIAVSDENGFFKLRKVKADDELNISGVGYKNGTAVAKFVEKFQIILESDGGVYEKDVTIPFGKIKNKLDVNSKSVVTGTELEKYPVTVLQNALTGTVTGVETYEYNSEPGWSETSMFIRGTRTVNSTARSPLIIVDDIERDLSFLDAYPIETVTVLKDAAATAIYGMRGANGAIVVTTKRGEAGKTRINVTQEVGFQRLAGLPMPQNSYNYVTTVNRARYLDGLTPLYDDEDVQRYYEVCTGKLDPAYKYSYFNTNWYEETLRPNAPQYRTNVSLSGGNKNARYFVSLTYLRQEGLYDTRWTKWNSGENRQHVLNRYNLRSNIDIDVTPGLNVSLDLGGRIDNIRQPLASTWTIFTIGTGENLPIYPVFCPNGEFFGPSANNEKNGPALVAMSGLDCNRRRNLYSNVTVTGKLDFITKGLAVKGTVGFDSYNTFQYTQSQNWDAFSYDMESSFTSSDQYMYTRQRTATSLSNPSTTPRSMSYNINMIGALTYNRTFGKHAINAQAMIRTYKNVVEGMNSSRRYLTYGGTLNYSFDERLILQATASYQGNDNLDPDNRYGFFPGLSAGWLLSEENWLKCDAINLLKIRASWGQAGYNPTIYTGLYDSSTAEVRYPYEGKYASATGYNFGKSQSYEEGVYESAAGNKNIKWELSEMVNLGIDFDFWNRKLYGSVDVFKENRSQILVNRSTVPDMYGVTVPQDSYGKTETKGFEITIGHSNKIKDFSYYVEGLVTFNRGKIVDIDEIDRDYDYQRITGNKIGYSSDFANYTTWLRFEKECWASDEDLISTSKEDAIAHPEKYPYQGSMKLGNAVFKDANGDRVIDSYDKVNYKYSQIPELVPSLKLGAAWKGIDVRVMLTAYLNRTVECRENMDYAGGWGGCSTHEVVNTWGYFTDDPTDPRNINAKYPRLSTTFSDNDRNFPRNTSNIFLRNGNFLSLRNVEVGYSLPLAMISRWGMTQCRFYFSGYNLHNWSEFENGFDPESPVNYLWNYPKTKSFTFGVNIGF